MDAKAKKQLRKEIVKAIEFAAREGIEDYRSVVFGWLCREAEIGANSLFCIREKALEHAKKNPVLI